MVNFIVATLGIKFTLIMIKLNMAIDNAEKALCRQLGVAMLDH